MSTEEDARKAKAARIREQIEELTSKPVGPDAPPDEPAIRPGESPRDFIQRRMAATTRRKPPATD